MAGAVARGPRRETPGDFGPDRVVAATTAFRPRKETSLFWEKFWRVVSKGLQAPRRPIEKRFKIELLEDRLKQPDSVRKLLS